MPNMTDAAYDALLDYIQSNAESLHICSSLPTTYAEATSTYSLGSKASPTVGTPADRTPNGREITVSAISDGSVSGDGDAAYWAIAKDSATSELLCAGDLSSSQGVTNGNTFTLTEFDIGVPDVV